MLRFATSCSRPPLMGFENLQPPFCIRVLPNPDAGRSFSMTSFLSAGDKKARGLLPSAATCFNMLKLPEYSSQRVLEEKLRLAIQSGTGFHLS